MPAFSRIAMALSSCNATTGDIISTTERLKQEFEVTTQRQEIVSCFLRDYQLSPEEVLVIPFELKLISLRYYLFSVLLTYCFTTFMLM